MKVRDANGKLIDTGEEQENFTTADLQRDDVVMPRVNINEGMDIFGRSSSTPKATTNPNNSIPLGKPVVDEKEIEEIKDRLSSIEQQLENIKDILKDYLSVTEEEIKE